jgi:hypothetical protein
VDVNDAADRLRQLLADAGFNLDRPDPITAWAAFKRFAAEPVDAQTTELWFEAGNGDPASDSPAYFDFVRMFMHDPDVRLGLRGRSIQSEDVSDMPPWFATIEALLAFKAGVEFDGWSFEIRIDGC